MSPWLVLAAGGVVGCGLFLVALGLRRASRPYRPPAWRLRRVSGDRRVLQLAAGAGVALVALVLSLIHI